MDPTQHHSGYPSPQQGYGGLPPPLPPGYGAPQQGYGVPQQGYGVPQQAFVAPPYRPTPLGLVPPYSPAAHGYSQPYAYPGWPSHAPYFPGAQSPMAPLHADGMAGPKAPTTPARAPHTHKMFVKDQREPGGKSASVYVRERYLAGNPVWEFEANVTTGEAKHAFSAHSAMDWTEFEKEVLKRLDGAVLPVELMYRFRETGKLSYLKDEADWRSALKNLDTKIRGARKLVAMEV
jgi:hypothetical protein